ncbi:Retrovirus-related Pol polyprotein from transposon [Dictyocoela muelleri]|nr:Retrovirus-related Pol polyprotein from transposon [Dictyocoela muelleri]
MTNNDYKYILSVIDIYSRFGFARPLIKKEGKDVANSLKDIFYEHRPCKFLQSDNGTEFKNKYIKEICEQFNIEQIHGRTNHPKSQGIVRRFNQTITKFLSKLLFNEDEKNWIKQLNKVIYNYNITIHSSSKKSSFEKYKNIKGFNDFNIKNDETARPNENLYEKDVFENDNWSSNETNENS